MGERGPPPDPNSKRQKRLHRAAEDNGKALAPMPTSGTLAAPQAPADLRAAGGQAWTSMWGEPQVRAGDLLTVERLARLEDQAADLRAALAEHGSILWRPLQSARGEVIGEESYEAPALTALRRLGAEQANLCKELGLTPGARARLGLVVVEIETKETFVDELRKRRAKRRGEPDPGIRQPVDHEGGRTG